ncbi:hypothetical protein HPG69_007914 [Diceros bicornis minor]|uniref:FYVE, RhoGEF and PH domain-containing protein 3 n=1 Tax=Diceros bicornis minor TaxID=77932 RepID=A0A7J7EB72_DICBM|nr:hypothetical protein HPG69_007914 [Diceros bicornis minor]
MESDAESSTPLGPVAAPGELDARPGCSSLGLPSGDPGKLRVLPVGPGAHCGDPAPGGAGSQTAAGDGPLDTGLTREPSGGTKIPNRDSGIDSPSCSVAGENFPCEEGGEAGPRPTVPGLHPEMAPDGTALREEAESDVGEGSGEEPDPENSPRRADTDPAKCSEPQKLLHIAQELLHTEETYVRRLHLLDQVFCTRLTAAGIPPEVTTGIFSNISSIYRFHGQFLLPELQKRITEEWDSNPRLGDILQKLAPFLKMYGEYVKNFDRAMELVSTWTQRSLLFKDIVQGIQKQGVCGNLTLQHHMLEPVQRIPRYELLLKDYLRRLPGDAPDRKDAERSLELISTAANHSNAAIRKMEKMHKLLEVYERLGGEEDIVNPANELIKEGHIQKLSAKNGTAQDRHLFLVQDVVKPNTAHTFIVTGKRRSLELLTRTEEEKKEWIQVIEATIEKHRQNSQTFKAFSGSFGQDEDPSFTADQPVICGKCSQFKAENGRQSRVCRQCFLTQPVAPASPGSEEPVEPKQSTEKPASADPPPSLFCGPLRVSDGGSAWSEVWATIPTSDPLELVLHLQGGSQAGRPPRAVPLSGCTVSVPDPAEKLDARHVWRLQQAQQSLLLSAPSAELQQQWLEALSAAALGDSARASRGALQPRAP